MSLQKPGFDTLQAHAGQTPDPATGSRAVPIYQTTSYVFDSVADAAEIFALHKDGNIYTRINNPTTDVFEKRVAALEGGVSAVAFASGMAAITAAVCNLAVAGEEIVSAATLYGGTYTLFSERFPNRYGIKAHIVDIDDLSAVESAINDKTRCVYFETVGNPGINIPDIQAVCEIAHRHGLPVLCDNTFGTPYLVRLKDWGVDVCIHSATKYLGGHGTSLGGVVVDYGTFPWKGNPRFADFNDPDPGYHGMVYADLGADAFAKKLRAQVLRDAGACLSPFNAFLLLMGIETLSLRIERHCYNAERVARFLKAHPRVNWVNYPALEDDKYHARQQKYMPKGCGAIMTFGIKGGLEAGKKFIESLTIFSHLANVADAKSLIIHPASTTHGQLDEEALKLSGISSDMIRVSVGLEDVEDLIEDLDRALQKSAE